MGKYYILGIDSLVKTFEIIDSGKNFLFEYSNQMDQNILNNISNDDIILGYYKSPISEIRMLFNVKKLNNKLTMEKMIEVVKGVILNDKQLIEKIEERFFVEIEEKQFSEIVILLISNIIEESNRYINTKGNRDESNRIIGGTNILLYGVPGSGKSYTIKNICSDETVMQRVVFHPDYTYSDFVGQIMPRVKGDKLEYVFSPGPFTKILDKAYKNPSKMHYLVIEEINRGNAPAIFGEVFQLLDRNDDESKGLVGESEYRISNYEIAKEVYDDSEHLVKIPANLSILATMNTSDQNVFTLDTAFQRRWELRHIKNNVLEAKHANNKIEDSEITWGAFASVINDKIDDISFDMSGLEDKRLGAYFAKEDELRKGKFPEKVLKYLWDDAFKMDKEAIFNDNIKSFDNLLSIYEDATPDKLKWILNYDVYGKMLNKVNKADEEKEDNN